MADPNNNILWQVLSKLAGGAGQGLQAGLFANNPQAASFYQNQQQQAQAQYNWEQQMAMRQGEQEQAQTNWAQQQQEAQNQQDLQNQLRIGSAITSGWLTEQDGGPIKFNGKSFAPAPYQAPTQADMITLDPEVATSLGLHPMGTNTSISGPVEKLQPLIDNYYKQKQAAQKIQGHQQTIGAYVDANITDPRWATMFKTRAGSLQSDADANGLWSEINGYLKDQSKVGEDYNVEHILAHPKDYKAEVVANAQDIFNRMHPVKAEDEAPDIPDRTPGIPTDARDEGLLQGLKPAVQNIVKGLVDYRLQLPNGYGRSKGMWPTYLALASQYDPSFDESQYQTRQKLQNDFTSGKSASSINAFNTVIAHVDRLGKHLESLNNTRFPAVNAAINAIQPALGGQDLAARLQSVQTDVQATASEAERAWRGVGGSEREIEQWKQRFSTSDSPKAQQQAVNELLGLLKGKLSSLKEQYETGMGRKATFHLMSPDTASILKSHNVSVDDLAPAAAYGGGSNTPQSFGPFDANKARAQYGY